MSSFVQATGALAAMLNVMPPPLTKKLEPDMQNVLAAHWGGGGGVTVLSLLPPHDTKPIDRTRTPKRPEIFRILPPLTVKPTLSGRRDQPTRHKW
jgi:hypothetical protein